MDDGPVSGEIVCTVKARLGVGLTLIKIWDVKDGLCCPVNGN